MNRDLIRSLARAIGGRVKSFLVQAAKEEAARAVRHFRARTQDAPRPADAAAADPPALASAPPEPTVAPLPAAVAPPSADASGQEPKRPAPRVPDTARRDEAPVPPVRETAERDDASASAALDLNAASRDELIALPGIGAARAEAIIRGRPFAAPEDLVERKILPGSVFENLKGRIGVA